MAEMTSAIAFLSRAELQTRGPAAPAPEPRGYFFSHTFSKLYLPCEFGTKP
jgi:hypothetical protein